MPAINWALLAGRDGRWCSASSRRATLAAAYGIAVTGTMAITTCCSFVVARHGGAGRRLAICGTLLPLVDLRTGHAELGEDRDGGWFPLVWACVFTA
jgi:KUP system potassium uptake protein